MTSRSTSIWGRMRRVPVWVRYGALVVIIASAWFGLRKAASSDYPTAVVQSGEFIIDLKEQGKLRAENSTTIMSPPARVNLQIIDMALEGTQVKEGDFLIQFDTTELRQTLDDQVAELDLAKVNLTRSRASIASNMARLQSSLENSRASYRLAQLRMDQVKFEADVRVEEEKLSLRQSEISLKQTEDEITAQTQIDSADIKSLELKVKQAEFDINKTGLDLKRLRITAPNAGLVVYKETWRGGEFSKVKVGDTPWRGAAIIELPDLSVMQVATSVSEVDVAKVKVGQMVDVTLDAYAEPTFHGEVISVAALARSEEGESDAKLFDVVVRIKESNTLLKPGMSAKARIVVDKLPGKRWVPIEAVFDKGGKMVVYRQSGASFQELEVLLGERNDVFVVIDSGVEVGERVCLIDPTQARDESASSKSSTKQESTSSSTGSSDAPSKKGVVRMWRGR